MRVTRLSLLCALITTLLDASAAVADEIAPAEGEEEVGSPLDSASAEPTSTEGDATEDPEATDQSALEPSEESKERARMHFKMGVDFYHESNYAAALVEFKRAYELAPHYKLKFNLGQTAFELQDYAYAIDNLNGYLDEGGEEVPPDRKRIVSDMIENLHSRLAFVTIISNEDGAQVYVDDRLIGETPFNNPVPIGAGRRRVVALKQGFVTVEQRLDLAARDNVDLALEFAAPPEAEQVVVTKVVSEELHPAVWVGIGTGVVAAGAATLAVLTAITKQQYEDELRQETSEERLDELRGRVKTRALMTDIALGVTGAALLATITTLFVEPEEKAPDSTGPILEPGVSLDSTHASLWLSGTF